MKLIKEHFVKLEKPIEEDFEVDESLIYLHEFSFGEFYKNDLKKFYDLDQYCKALKEWERKYIKPTPKWKKFSEGKPNNGQEIYLEWDGLLNRYDEYCATNFFSKFLIVTNKDSYYFEGDYEGNYWASVEEHKEEIKYFEEHQQVFEDWEFVESNSKDNPYYNGEEHFIKGVSMITIHDKGFCVSKDHITIYYGKNGPNAVEILKLICKDNDIEL